MNSYLLETEDFSAREHEVEAIIAKEKFSGATLSIYDLEENTLDNALEDLDTYSFLSDKKIIIIRNIESISIDQEKEKIEHYKKYTV